MNDYRCVVTVEGMARGTERQEYLQFHATQCVSTWSWGLQPGTALIDWASVVDRPILPMSALKIEFFRASDNQLLHTFHGICEQVAKSVGDGWGVGVPAVCGLAVFFELRCGVLLLQPSGVAAGEWALDSEVLAHLPEGLQHVEQDLHERAVDGA